MEHIKMISVSEAEAIILAHQQNYGVEELSFLNALGRVLAEPLLADRDMPPFNRVTMDGIAIRFADYEAGCRNFSISAVQAAGEAPAGELALNACIEIMTGAVLPPATDTVIPYEHLHLKNGYAEVFEPAIQGRNVHVQGRDRSKGELVLDAGRVIGPAEISIAASLGKSTLAVRKLPSILVLSSGDELVEVEAKPLPYQIRRSNNYAIHSALRKYGIAAEMRHLPDDLDYINRELALYLKQFDVIVLTGGVSMGKFDFIPQALEANGVKKLFHKVRQRPGKPFWFGKFAEHGLVFALPGNPVSTFLCLHRYVLPWLERSLKFPDKGAIYAKLLKSIQFEPDLVYFMQVKLKYDDTACLCAEPLEGQGSGDFANLVDSDGFLELPRERNKFEAGEIFRVVPFR